MNDQSSTPSAPRVNLPAHTSAQIRDSSGSNGGASDTRKSRPTSTDFHSNEVRSVTVTGYVHNFTRARLISPN